jgi:hypothetical protein
MVGSIERRRGPYPLASFRLPLSRTRGDSTAWHDALILSAVRRFCRLPMTGPKNYECQNVFVFCAYRRSTHVADAHHGLRHTVVLNTRAGLRRQAYPHRGGTAGLISLSGRSSGAGWSSVVAAYGARPLIPGTQRPTGQRAHVWAHTTGIGIGRSPTRKETYETLRIEFQ